jgi:hypothetical protein
MNDSRYPYTYACDLIRAFAGYNAEGTKLSRSDASKIRSKIAEILGIQDEDLAKELADYYMKHSQEIAEQGATELALLLKSRI